MALPCDIDDDAYLSVVQQTLTQLLQTQQPDFVIYDAGVDVYQFDPLGS